MGIFSKRPKTITLEDHKAVLQGGRNPVTGQTTLMTEQDADSYRKFIREFTAALKPDGMVEIQLAQRLAQDTWRINRLHAIEENIFALGHSEPFAKIESAHPESTPPWSRPWRSAATRRPSPTSPSASSASQGTSTPTSNSCSGFSRSASPFSKRKRP